MKILLLLLPLCVLPASVVIAEDQPAAPAEIDDRFYERKPGITANEEQSARCKQLRHRIAELKGKPQRRHAAVERYRNECQSGAALSNQRPGNGGPFD
ncbi:MAG TPA: hypothetical protein VLB10_00915 [Gammaproteobacteria bacterium]|nr:hypothetical protein [Gammaproteobacteria bacterium]